MLNALHALKQEVEARRTDYPIEPEAARASILMMGGEVSGGANFNVVPGAFSFSVDRRLNPEEDFDTEKSRLLDAIRGAGVGAEIDVIQVAKDAMEAFGDREIPLQVAVMGCVVNGPGEARDADIGIAAGKRRGHLFVKGRNVAVVPEDEMVPTLVEWAEFIHEHGVEAAVARVDTEKAAREAEKDRAALLQEQGADANASEQRVDLIHKRIES